MSQKTNINLASAAELTKLKGVGQGLAARIVDYRNTVGRFRTVAELAAVPGITDRMIRIFEDDVTVESPGDEKEFPPFVVQVQLQNAAGDPYKGHRVIAHFTRRERLPADTDDAPEVVLCEVEIAAELSD